MEDLFPSVSMPFQSINLPCLQWRIPCCLYCDLHKGAGAHQHGLRRPYVKPCTGSQQEVMQELAPGVHLASTTRVRVMSHHIQPYTEAAKSGAMQQNQRTLHPGKLDPLFKMTALMSRCWGREEREGQVTEQNSSTSGILQSLTTWGSRGR